MIPSAQNPDRESQDQGVVLFRKQFYQKQGNRSNSKCSRPIKCTTDSKWPFSMLCIIGYKNYPHLWNVKLTPQDNPSLPYSISHYFLVVPKNKQPANYFTPLKKKHLHLKNGMRWNSLQNVSRATKKLAFTK